LEGIDFLAVRRSFVVCMKDNAIQSTFNLIARAKSFLSFGVIIFKFNFVSGIFNPLLLEISPPSVTIHFMAFALLLLTFNLTLPSLIRSRCPTDIELKISLWGK
jgi:hypothetical protein